MKGGCWSPGLCTQVRLSLRHLQLYRDRAHTGRSGRRQLQELGFQKDPGAWAPGREGTGRGLPTLTLLCPEAGRAVTPEGQTDTPGPQGWHQQDAKAGVGGAGCFSREGHGEQPGASLVPAATTLEKLTTSVITEAGGGETSKPL